jgi:hypothetical protein
MGIVTFEGIVEQGQIRLKNNVRLPENTRVFVVVPDVQVEKVAHIFTPRLARREDATDFEMEVSRE